MLVSRSLSTSKKNLHSNNNRLQLPAVSTTAPTYNTGMMSNLHPDYSFPSEEFLQASTNHVHPATMILDMTADSISWERKEASDDELKKATAASLETAQQEAAMNKFREEQDLQQAINCSMSTTHNSSFTEDEIGNDWMFQDEEERKRRVAKAKVARIEAGRMKMVDRVLAKNTQNMHLHKKKRDLDSLEKRQRREAKKLAVKMGSVKDVESVLVPILRSKMIPPSQEEDYERGIIKDVNGKPFDSQSIVERLQEYHGSDSSSDSDVDLNKKPKSKKN